MRRVLILCCLLALLVGGRQINAAVSVTTTPSFTNFQSSLWSPYLQAGIINLPWTSLLIGAKKISTRGFEDRLNSYAWGMAVFNGDLYVGTGRHPGLSPVMDMIKMQIPMGTAGLQFPDMPTTPNVPDWLDSTNPAAPFVKDSQKFDIWNGGAACEIWRFNHLNRRWSIVWKAPYVKSVLTIPGTTDFYYTPASAGIRKMEVFTDAGGKSIMMAFNGVGLPFSQGGVSFVDPLKSKLAYWSSDGLTWDGVPSLYPQMGLETRASTVYNNQLYVATVNAQTRKAGIWRLSTAGPTSGGTWDWEQVDTSDIPVFSTAAADLTKTNTAFVCLKAFNGKLYVGTENFKEGYQLWYGVQTASGAGTNTWDWTKIKDHGNSFWAGTMEVFKENLYMGSVGVQVTPTGGFSGFDLIRIKPDNSQDLIVGGTLSLTSPPQSLSKWPSGFGNPFNFYCWSLKEHNGKLYLGTFDMSIMMKELMMANGGHLPAAMSAMEPFLKLSISGADLWMSSDGVSWLPVMLNGFGSNFNYGVRNMLNFEDKLVCGTANPFYGCDIYQMSW